MTDASNSPPRRRRRPWASILGLAISATCILWVYRSVEHDRMFEAVKEVDPFWLFGSVGFTLVSYFIRAFRWPYYFGSTVLTFADSFRCLILGFFMNNVLPARIGEFIRAHLGGRATKQSRTTVLATVAGERLADGLTISLIFSILFPIYADSGDIEQSQGLFLVSGAFLAVSIGTCVVLVMRHRLFEVLERLRNRLPGNVASFALIRARRFIEGLEPMFQPKRLAVISLLSVVIWGVELAAYHCVASAFGVPLGLGHLSLFLAAVNFSSLIPSAPGGLGVIEFFATAALAHVGVERESALAMVAAQHLIQISVVGIPGIYFFFHNLGGRLPEAESEEEDSALLVRVPAPAVDTKFTAADVSSGPVALTIVIPAYNEAERILPTLESVSQYLSARSARVSQAQFEIVVVDDGSSDNTAAVVLEAAQKHRQVRLISLPRNRGKGYAVRLGVLNARGARILFNDADGATPIAELERLDAALDQGADIAIGSRALPSTDVRVSTNAGRKIIGRVFNGIANALLVPGIADTQCGFKLFRAEAAMPLFERQTAERFSFDVEILFLAKRAGFTIQEVPINWTNVPGSKVNLVADSMKMFFDLCRFRLYAARGLYPPIERRSGQTSDIAVRVAAHEN